MNIRPMITADLPRVAALAGQLVKQHHQFDAERFFITDDIEAGYEWWLGKQLQEPQVVLLVAEVAGTVQGYVYGSLEGRDWARLLDAHGAVHDVFVDVAHRRAGLARALLTAAMAALKAKGARSIVLSTATPNLSAQKLFASLGFRSTMIEMTRSA